MFNRIIIALVLAGVTAAGAYIYWRGYHDSTGAHERAEMKTEIKVRRNYEKIDRKTPFGADKRAAAEWMQHYTVGK